MRTRGIIAALAATAAVAATTGTALAADDAWTATDEQTQSGHTATQSANGRILTSDADSYTILVDCKVMSTDVPPMISAGFDACYLLGADGNRFPTQHHDAVPGAFGMIAEVMDVPKQRYRTCVQAHVFFQDNFNMVFTPICTP